MNLNQTEQSPCKGCEKHNKLFPSCMESCKKLSEWQEQRLRSNDHNIFYDFLDLNTYNLGE